ncbi:MAG: Crp/Fnr family transcriptional regulator [Aestuariivirgaceae bacterium]
MDTRSEINTSSNRLLNFLSPGDRAILAPHMKRVSLVTRKLLEKANQPIEHVYFPDDGVASVVGTAKTMGDYEIGMIGKEGMTGLMVVLGSNQSPLQTFVQVAGSALVIEADQLRKAMADSPTIRDLMLMYVQVFLVQISQTAIANIAALLPQRLARWLLMCEDRLTSKHIPVTHEFLAVMLGVQRSGVTIALGELQERGLIQAERGRIHVLDRKTLVKLTNGTYGVAEAEYKRLFGSRPH